MRANPMSLKDVKTQNGVISSNLYIAGLAAKGLLVCGVIAQAFFIPLLGSVHVALPFVLSITNIASAITLIAVNHATTKRLIDVASDSIEISANEKSTNRP
jgi:hypothetical protein